MQTISYVICDAGEGSQYIQWFERALTDEEVDALMDADRYDTYASGDGIQIAEMHFPDEFSVLGWAALNSITLKNYEEVLKIMQGNW